MVARIIPATRTDGPARLNMARRPIGAVWLLRRCANVAVAATLLVLPSPALAANTVQITKLSDVPFGTITNFGADTIRSQSVCIFSGTGSKGYNVRASGSGPSSAFTLTNGSKLLDYVVQWNSSSGRASGTTLSPNVTLTGLKSTATNATCASGPATTASLVLIVRSTAAASATAGSYSGTLTLVFAPE